MSEPSKPVANRQPEATTPVPPKKSSALLYVLLPILLLVIALFGVDNFYMYNAVEEGAKRLEAASTAKAEQGLDENKNYFLDRAEVQKALLLAPTSSDTSSGVLQEKYSWWPLLTNRRFIVVMYKDKEGKQYDSHEVGNLTYFAAAEEKMPDGTTPPPPSTGEAPTSPPPSPKSPPAGKTKTDDQPAEKTPAEKTPAEKTPAATPPETKPDDEA